VRNKIIFFFMLSLLILIPGCTNGTQWQAQWDQFTWVDYFFEDQYYDKAAILIPFRFSGSEEKYYVQLDTGAPSLLNGNTFSDIQKAIDVKEHTSSSVTLDGMLAGNKFKEKNFYLKNNYGLTLEELQKAEYKKIGNLGLDFFEDSLLILDFPRSRFMIADSLRQVPEAIIENSEFTEVEYRYGKLFLDTEIGGRELTLIYDTGASLFPIATTKDIWLELTATKAEEADVFLEGPSWGETAVFKGAKAQNNWNFGGLTIEKPLIFHETSGLENLDFHAYPYRLDGVLGNAVFYDDYIITIDLKNNKFGIKEVKQ